jgi:hypothetical protein
MRKSGQLKTPYSNGTTHVTVLAHPCASRHSCIHAHHIRSPGLHRKVSLSCTKAEGQPHKISRCIRSKQQAPYSGDSCQAGQRQTKSDWTGQNTRRTPYGHDLGTTIEKGIQHRSERGPVDTCAHCGGPAKVIADTSDRCIEDQQVIDIILAHLKKKDRLPSLPNALPETRAPPHQQ